MDLVKDNYRESQDHFQEERHCLACQSNRILFRCFHFFIMSPHNRKTLLLAPLIFHLFLLNSSSKLNLLHSDKVFHLFQFLTVWKFPSSFLIIYSFGDEKPDINAKCKNLTKWREKSFEFCGFFDKMRHRGNCLWAPKTKNNQVCQFSFEHFENKRAKDKVQCFRLTWGQWANDKDEISCKTFRKKGHNVRNKSLFFLNFVTWKSWKRPTVLMVLYDIQKHFKMFTVCCGIYEFDLMGLTYLPLVFFWL